MRGMTILGSIECGLNFKLYLPAIPTDVYNADPRLKNNTAATAATGMAI
jgi:hypothetical protein